MAAECVNWYSQPSEGPLRKRPDETWMRYWERVADSRHPVNCDCLHHVLRKRGITETPPL